MNARRSDRVRELFDEVADLESGARVAFLERAEPDEDLRREVLELMGADDHPLAILDATLESLVGAGSATAPDLGAYVGRQVGPYHIEDILGHGGMGTVFLAKRGDIGLTVALKLVRGALGDPSRIARFRQEASVLARLNHPFIAQLIDVGVADDGTPYLAMEYVRGSPITAWCERQKLGVTKRLRLFIELCDAVAFAHQHLVVHRDIKPLNILVTPEGVVKLLDFGVAKLLDAEDDDSVQTTAGTRLLSPEYASPEQVLGVAVSTATDVHGLGILLYELLTGARPFGAPGMRQTQLLASILHDEARRPSDAMAVKPASVGDLDAICFKALAKAPRDRYATVAEFADDVRRHLDGLPVQARLPTIRYRVGKFVRRNALAVAVASLAVALLATGAGVAAWRANEARMALAQAQQLSTFLLDVFKATDPAETRGSDAPMKSYLDLAIVYMDGLAGQPDAQARLLTILSQAYLGLGDYEKADSLAQRSLELNRTLGGGHDADIAASLVALGNARFERGQAVAAIQPLRTALALQRMAVGNRSDVTTETMLRLAEALAGQGEYVEAASLSREALALRLTDPSRRDEAVADATARLGRVLALDGDAQIEAEKLLRASLAIRRSLYRPDDYRMDRSLTPLSQFLAQFSHAREAEQMARQALALRRGVYGADHPRTVTALNNLASTILAQNRISEARDMYRQVVTQYERAFGGDHLMLAVAIKNVSSTFLKERRLDSAEVHLNRALQMRSRLEGAGDPDVALLHHELGDLQRNAGRLAQAEASFREAHHQLTLALGEANPATLRAGSMLGGVLVQRGRLAEGERVLRPIVARQSEMLGEPHPDLTRSLTFLAASLTASGKWAEALPLHEGALRAARTGLPMDHPIRKEVVAGIMTYFRARGQPERAERIREEEAGIAFAKP